MQLSTLSYLKKDTGRGEKVRWERSGNTVLWEARSMMGLGDMFGPGLLDSLRQVTAFKGFLEHSPHSVR